MTTHRKHERMHSFFAFFLANDLIRKNPMNALKNPKTPDIVPTDYFPPDEFEKVLAATDKYEYGGGNDSKHRAQRLRALTLLMRWSGLAILDATSLERERLSKNENGDDQIFLYRAKTGVPVYVVIPNEVGDALRGCPTCIRATSSGQGTAIRAARPKAFQRSYWKLFKLAKIQRPDGMRKRCHLICSAIPSRSSCY